MCAHEGMMSNTSACVCMCAHEGKTVRISVCMCVSSYIYDG